MDKREQALKSSIDAKADLSDLTRSTSLITGLSERVTYLTKMQDKLDSLNLLIDNGKAEWHEQLNILGKTVLDKADQSWMEEFEERLRAELMALINGADDGNAGDTVTRREFDRKIAGLNKKVKAAGQRGESSSDGSRTAMPTMPTSSTTPVDPNTSSARAYALSVTDVVVSSSCTNWIITSSASDNPSGNAR